MAIKLLAVLVVFALAKGLPDLSRMRDFSRLRVWLELLAQMGGKLQTALAILVPVTLCLLLQWGLHGWLFGLLSFAFAVCVLWYSWGPRDLSEDIDAVVKAPDSDRRLAAAQWLRPDGVEEPLAFEAPALVDATFQSALKRWFGVLFWFLLLGPAGALLYRLVQLLAWSSPFTSQQGEGLALARRLSLILDWAPSHLMALALAVASDFDAVFHTWKAYHDRMGKGYFSLDLGFLSAIARASVDADVIAGDGYAEDINDPLVELDDARHLLVRVLIVWLAVAGLLVLGGIGG
ncbi:beta-lactamase induction protein [Tahibacter amnicola]|uniref:Beta-lactamase induction protein n=1 Tax=Tahibacter amnicola TaxID=2976241 RepID=A0ABY6BDI3_9GAMM|nr:beta-lactamase induction protein [Tahibacter amnicola]UXI68093.1 beta-lactamase induction protein [Tahibacter amnicola]